jgi:hypothetical protein
MKNNDIMQDGLFLPSYVPEFKTAAEFADEKIAMLLEDFCIHLTEEDMAHIRSFKTEADINLAVKGMLNKYWK